MVVAYLLKLEHRTPASVHHCNTHSYTHSAWRLRCTVWLLLFGTCCTPAYPYSSCQLLAAACSPYVQCQAAIDVAPRRGGLWHSLCCYVPCQAQLSQRARLMNAAACCCCCLHSSVQLCRHAASAAGCSRQQLLLLKAGSAASQSLSPAQHPCTQQHIGQAGAAEPTATAGTSESAHHDSHKGVWCMALGQGTNRPGARDS
jgi:hypothetical protein